MTLPLWFLALSFFAGMLLAHAAGVRWRLRTGDGRKSTGDDVATAAVLGLLSLLLGFTFSLCMERYETRRELVIAESNALESAWLRSSLLAARDAECLRSMLRDYVDLRVAFGTAADSRLAEALHEKSRVLQLKLWMHAEKSLAAVRETPLSPFVLSPLNTAFDLATERAVARMEHVPTRILSVLALYALIAAGMIGRTTGKRTPATTAMFVLLTLAGTLIVDLDRPSNGPIQVPEGAMKSLQASWKTVPTLSCEGGM